MSRTRAGHAVTVHFPHRVREVAKELGYQGGYSLDLTVPGPDGLKWDFTRARDRMKAWKLIFRDQPYMTIGSPPCTAFSILQNLNQKTPELVEKLREEHGIYMVGDSRMNIAGLNEKTVPVLAKAIIDAGI